ncbi:hypothetical protein FQZ97_787380 [compost metagenome]
MGHALALARGVLQPQAPAGPDLARAGAKAQVVGGEGKARLAPLRGQATAEFVQRQRGQARAQAGFHVPQRQVGGDAGHLPPFHVGPGAHRALAGEHLDAPVGQVHIGPQARHVHAGEIGEQLAVPALPARLAFGLAAQVEQGLAQVGAQAQALTPFGGRSGVEPELVVARLVARHEIQRAQLQRRLATQVVGPAHGAVLDHELGLGKKPVGGRVVTAVRPGQVQPGHLDVALRGAPHVEHRRGDHHLLEAQPPQRTDRQRGAHARQVQGFAPGGVEQPHVAQLEGGHQGGQEIGQPVVPRRSGLGPDRPHAHGYPYRGAGPAFQVGTPLADSRHNPQMQHAQGECEQAPDGQHQPEQQPRRHGKCLEGSRGGCTHRRFGGICRALMVHVHCKL